MKCAAGFVLKAGEPCAKCGAGAGGPCWEYFRAVEDTMKRIAKQKTTEELKVDDELAYENADYEGGYDTIINLARAALK